MSDKDFHLAVLLAPYWRIHILDVYPEPRKKAPRIINESWLIVKTIDVVQDKRTPPEEEPDNIRIYVPLDLNRRSILRRLDDIIASYNGEASEENKMSFRIDVVRLFMQVEVYDQYWYVRHTPKDRSHSTEATELVKEFIARLEDIQDLDSETFPFDMIDELKEEFYIEA